MEIELKHHFHIESARFLPNLPDGHPCKNMHGHSFKITLCFKGEMNKELGWLIDFNQIKEGFAPVKKNLDHKVLNEVSGLENPTSENLAVWIFNKTRQGLPQLIWVSVSETQDTECRYPT